MPGVAEQFAIAEAKLRAWSSVDGDDSNDESYDEDFMPSSESSLPAGEHPGDLWIGDGVLLPGLPMVPSWGWQSLGFLAMGLTAVPTEHHPGAALLRDLLRGHLCQLGARHGSCEPESDSSRTLSPETLCSSLCSLEMVSPSELTAKLLGSLGGELPPPSSQSALRGLVWPRCQDSLSPMPYAEACLSPAEDEVVLSKDFTLRRKISDVASSGVVSLEEEDEEEDEEEEEAEEP